MRNLGEYIALGIIGSLGVVSVAALLIVVWTTEPWFIRMFRKRRPSDLDRLHLRVGPVEVEREPLVIDPPKQLAELKEAKK